MVYISRENEKMHQKSPSVTRETGNSDCEKTWRRLRLGVFLLILSKILIFATICFIMDAVNNLDGGQNEQAFLI